MIEAWLSESGLAQCPDAGQCTESYGCPMGWCPCPTVPICQCARQYNGAIAPLLPMRLSLIIWYQGEGNSGLPDNCTRSSPPFRSPADDV